MDLGFDPENMLAARLPLPRGQYQTRRREAAVLRQLLTRVQALPGVVAAADASSLPPYGGIRSEIDDRGQDAHGDGGSSSSSCSEGYFRTLGCALLRGRC